jgi:hypothetical protein
MGFNHQEPTLQGMSKHGQRLETSATIGPKAMKTDYTLSRREEREQQQMEEAVFNALNRASVGITVVLGCYLVWAFVVGLSA